MGFFSKLTKLAIDIAVIPLSITADVITLGGELTDKRKSYTEKNLKDIKNDFDEMKNEL